MSNLNALIAQGVQFKAPPDPFEQYGRMQQLEQNRQTNQLNQMKMAEQQQGLDERAQIRQLDPGAANYLQQLTRINPKLGVEFGKLQGEAATAKLTQQKTRVEMAAARKKLEAQALRDSSLNPTDEKLIANHTALLQSGMYLPEEHAGLEEELRQMLAVPFEQRKAMFAQQGATATDLQPKFQNFNIQGKGVQTGMVQGGQFTPGKLYESSDVLSPEAQAQKLAMAQAGKSSTTTIVKLPEQEKAFEQELGKTQAKRIIDNKIIAEDAAQIMRTNQVGRDLLKSGAITGTGANFFIGLNNALQQAGIDAGYNDAAANSQAYAAAMGANVGRIIKQFGAGTGLSDADREYAAQMAGGKITLTEKALRRILDINDRVAGTVIDAHNKDVAGVKTNIPLTVARPVSSSPKGAGAPAAAKTVTRTGMANGRKVIQYSDGGIEYAN